MFFDDDLPVWGFIGKTEAGKPPAGADASSAPPLRSFLFTHFHFDIGYNGNQVCRVCDGGDVRLVGPGFRLAHGNGGIGPVAAVGAHTEAILGELGYDAARIAALREAGVV